MTSTLEEGNSILFDINEYNNALNDRLPNGLTDNLTFDKKTKQFFNPLNRGFEETNKSANSADYTDITVSSFQVNITNFNSVISNIPEDRDIIALTGLTDSDGVFKGLISHYIDGDDQLKLNVYKKNEETGNYELLSLPVNKVRDFTLDNIFFFAKYFFPECNIENLGVADFYERTDGSKYDDIQLFEFGLENGFRFADPDTTIGDGGVGSGGSPCSMAVHNCASGQPNTVCRAIPGSLNNVRCLQPIICPLESTASELSKNGLTNELDQLDAFLLELDLYSLRNQLDNSNEGKFFNRAYYTVSSHFKESLDLELLLAIVNSSMDIGEFVSAFKNNSSDVVLTEDVYNSAIEIAQLSAEKSDSNVYKELMTEMIERTNIYKNKNIEEIREMLNL